MAIRDATGLTNYHAPYLVITGSVTVGSLELHEARQQVATGVELRRESDG